MSVSLPMAIIFGVVVVVFLTLFFISKGKYDEYTEPLDEKKYRMKKLMPMALFLLEKINYKYSTKYDMKLLSKILILNGAKYAQYYLQVHWANKIAFILLLMLLLSGIGLGVGPDISFGVFSLIVLVGIFFFTDNELNEKMKTRNLMIQMDFPDFLNKLVLLINAGMTVPRAWEKIVQDNKKDRPLYDELAFTLAEVRAGKSEYQAYEDFAKRCKMQEITKFISVVLQNLKKGSDEMVYTLRFQAKDCWEMRKNAAKRLGEEASTKMLFPMMMMFIAILIIVALPAVLSMQGF